MNSLELFSIVEPNYFVGGPTPNATHDVPDSVVHLLDELGVTGAARMRKETVEQWDHQESV